MTFVEIRQLLFFADFVGVFGFRSAGCFNFDFGGVGLGGWRYDFRCGSEGYSNAESDCHGGGDYKQKDSDIDRLGLLLFRHVW